MNAPRRTPRRVINGVLLLDKPSGIGSNSALQQVKRLFNAQKAGHTGTLDPMASGLLPLCFGEATKFAAELLEANKGYVATVRLGVSTDSGDADGNVVQERPVHCSLNDIEGVTSRFLGNIEQMPPMYSALKKDGKPLYEYARSGIEVPRDARSVCVEVLEVGEFDHDCFQMRVRCSKGTYIRSLAMDIGEALGCGAHLIALRRTSIGRFTLNEAVSMDQMTQTPVTDLEQFLRPVDHLVSAFPTLKLDEAETIRLGHGQRFRPARVPEADGVFRLYGENEQFLGTGRYADGVLHPERLLASI